MDDADLWRLRGQYAACPQEDDGGARRAAELLERIAGARASTLLGLYVQAEALCFLLGCEDGCCRSLEAQLARGLRDVALSLLGGTLPG